MVKGVLHVTVQGCQGIDDDSWFNKADPYGIVTCGATKHKTKVAKNAGKNPVWNDESQFNIENEDSIEFRVYDNDVGFDDFMGSCKISLSGVFSKGSSKETVPLKTKDGKEKGHVVVELRFSGAGGTGHKSEPHSSGHGVIPGGGHGDSHGGSHGGHGDKPKKEKKKKENKGDGSSSSSSDSD